MQKLESVPSKSPATQTRVAGLHHRYSLACRCRGSGRGRTRRWRRLSGVSLRRGPVRIVRYCAARCTRASRGRGGSRWAVRVVRGDVRVVATEHSEEADDHRESDEAADDPARIAGVVRVHPAVGAAVSRPIGVVLIGHFSAPCYTSRRTTLVLASRSDGTVRTVFQLAWSVLRSLLRSSALLPDRDALPAIKPEKPYTTVVVGRFQR
jgi:hypothetical protein